METFAHVNGDFSQVRSSMDGGRATGAMGKDARSPSDSVRPWLGDDPLWRRSGRLAPARGQFANGVRRSARLDPPFASCWSGPADPRSGVESLLRSSRRVRAFFPAATGRLNRTVAIPDQFLRIGGQTMSTTEAVRNVQVASSGRQRHSFRRIRKRGTRIPRWSTLRRAVGGKKDWDLFKK